MDIYRRVLGFRDKVSWVRSCMLDTEKTELPDEGTTVPSSEKTPHSRREKTGYRKHRYSPKARKDTHPREMMVV